MAFPHPAATTMLPALEGDLAVCPSVDLYTLLAALALSGTLELIRPFEPNEERVELRVRRGRLVGAETSSPRLFLGELLVKHYGVSLEAVIDGLKRQSMARKSGRIPARLGQLLIETRQVTAEVLRRALDDAVIRLALPVLTWQEGRFSFWNEGSGGPDKLPDPAHLVQPDVRLEELIARGHTV